MIKVRRCKCIVLILAILVCLYPYITYAGELTEDTVEEYTVSEAFSNEEIVEFMKVSGDIAEFCEAQNEIRESEYFSIAENIASVSSIDDATTDLIKEIDSKYELELPNETENELIENGNIFVQRDSRGIITDTWYLYYTTSDTAFYVRAAGIDPDNSLELISGTLLCYYLNNSSWVKLDDVHFNKSSVKNGIVYTWAIDKWGVKEKFVYNIAVTAGGQVFSFSNVDNDYEYKRYNFEAEPYTSLTANGGQRHHFVPATALNNNGFNSNTAYCIRMITADHYNTGSYGSSTYVRNSSNLLASGQYDEALQMEVDDLKSEMDSEGGTQTLQQKYYNEVVICLVQYELLFGIS